MQKIQHLSNRSSQEERERVGEIAIIQINFPTQKARVYVLKSENLRRPLLGTSLWNFRTPKIKTLIASERENGHLQRRKKETAWHRNTGCWKKMEQYLSNWREMVFDLSSRPDKMSLNNDGRITVFIQDRPQKVHFLWILQLGVAWEAVLQSN